MEELRVLGLLCLALSGAGALEVTIPQREYEFARGDNITLPCRFKSKLTNPGLVIISWSLEGLQAGAEETLILSYYSNNKHTDIKAVYEGRVSVLADVATGKADLRLASITLADNKMFQCRIQIPGDDEGTPADTARLVVLVAPSKPLCAIQGNAVYGQNINVTCFSEEGSPPPVYKWVEHDVNNNLRPRDPRTTEKNGALTLYNITRETSGFFVCTSSNKIRSASCNLTLAVMPPTMNVAAVAGGIAAGAGALILLGILIYCCCCREKKGKQEEYAMGVQEDEYRDKAPERNGESRAERQDDYDERSERGHDRRSEYDDRRSEYDDRRSEYDDRRRDYDDRRSDYDDRRSDYSDRRERYDDRRYDDDDRARPPAPPNNKPQRMDYDD